ncbi:MAG: hypothetical protein KGH98_01075 [Candidatus Micrarchaeota archaeon]|nr:hypothetical protein [Candidatus Micrarchaeota archaeon]
MSKQVHKVAKGVEDFTKKERKLLEETFFRVGNAKGAANELTDKNLLKITPKQALTILKEDGVIKHTIKPRLTDGETTDIGILKGQLYTIPEIMAVTDRSAALIYTAASTYEAKLIGEKRERIRRANQPDYTTCP